MKILAIDTSSAACSVALLIDDELYYIHKIMPLQQAQHILLLINDLLLDKNIAIKQLDTLAFGCGPGSFTGLRIAVSVIQGLGFGLQLPVIPISSLAALAQATYQDLGWNRILAAIDARMAEVYWGTYEVIDTGLVNLVESEKISKPEQVRAPKDWYGAGNAWEVYRNQIPYIPLNVDSERVPTASAVALLAKAKYLKKEWVSAAEALPVYLRDQVATPKL